jgi:uncharacterized protein (DUF1800 family)
MGTNLSNLDPNRAWAPFDPNAQRPWSRALAAHLFRRAGFGATSAELDEAVKAGPGATVQRLCNPPATPEAAEFESTSATLAQRTAATGNPQQLAAWWLHRMCNTPDPLREKLTLFWHGHFATGAAKVGKPALMLQQNDLLRRHAAGPFGRMVKAVSRDPAMLIYLDSTSNRRIHPNENYARELLELFCLGVGNYTEADIKEIARAFTGWEVRGKHFAFNAIQHDTGTKRFFDFGGNVDGDGAVDVVLKQPAAARFISRKLIRFFVFDEPAAPDALVETLAEELRRNGFEVGPVVKRILGSELFFSEAAVGRKVRSPVELGVGLVRSLGAATNLLRLAAGLGDLGQALFQPPNVKGWDGGRAWINSSTLLGRANLVRQLMMEGPTRFFGGGTDLASIATRAGAETPEKTVDWLLELLVATPLPAAARGQLVQLLKDKNGPGDRGRRIAEVIHVIGTMPEFQLA